MARPNEAFCQRIWGNYSQMNMRIDEKEFMHVLTSPPEVYLLEGEGDFISQTFVSSRKESNLEIINQLLNRITIENDMPFTYQDKVYITNVLRRLGVTDVQNFMSQVQKLKEENQSTQQLVALYWQNLAQLRTMVEDFRQSSSSETNVEETAFINTLHRLGVSDANSFVTWALGGEENPQEERVHSIYSADVRELRRLAELYHRETGTEPSWEGEGYGAVSELYLHERIMDRLKTGLIYQIMQNFGVSRSGSYTGISNTDLRLSDHYRMTKNILLNKLKNTVRNEEMPLSFYHANTYEEDFSADWDFDESSTTNTTLASVLLQLIDSVYEQRSTRQLFDSSVWLHLEGSLYQAAENMFFRLSDEESVFLQDIMQESAAYYDQNTQYRRELNMLHSILGGEDNTFLPGNASVVREVPGESTNLRETFGTETLRERAGAAKDEINALNLTQRYTSENNIQGAPGQGEDNAFPPGDTSVVREIPGESTRLLETFGTETLRERTGVQGDEINALSLTQRMSAENLLGIIEENEETIAREVERIDRQNAENRATYERFLRELRTEKRERTGRRDGALRMRRESLQALSDPKELLHRYQMEREEAGKSEAAAARSAFENLPQDSRRIYQALDEYMQSRGSQRETPKDARNDIGTLMRDVEQVRLTRERTRAELQYLEREAASRQDAAGAVGAEGAGGSLGATRQAARAAAQEASPLSLVHKEAAESQIDETLLEELMQRSSREKVHSEVTEQSIQSVTHQTQNTNVTQLSTREIAESADIAEMIQRGVRRQMGEISEQVYSRIEKKLQNERKRRGI